MNTYSRTGDTHPPLLGTPTHRADSSALPIARGVVSSSSRGGDQRAHPNGLPTDSMFLRPRHCCDSRRRLRRRPHPSPTSPPAAAPSDRHGLSLRQADALSPRTRRACHIRGALHRVPVRAVPPTACSGTATPARNRPPHWRTRTPRDHHEADDRTAAYAPHRQQCRQRTDQPDHEQTDRHVPHFGDCHRIGVRRPGWRPQRRKHRSGHARTMRWNCR